MYNFIMSLVLRTYKCNDDIKASLMELIHQFTHDVTTILGASYYVKITARPDLNF